MKLFRNARFFWVYPLAVALFATASTSETSLRLGVILVFLGEAVRVWADGYVGHVKVNAKQPWRQDQQSGHLITAGPYAYVRHPLYVGTFLIGVGFSIAARSLPLAVASLAFFLLVYPKKARREEQLILQEWGADYASYQTLVPRWWPTFRRYPSPHGQWSWQGIRASKEWKTLLWVIVALLAIYLWEEWFHEREIFTDAQWVKQTILVGLIVVLVASDGIIELVSRSGAAKKYSGAKPI